MIRQVKKILRRKRHYIDSKVFVLLEVVGLGLLIYLTYLDPINFLYMYGVMHIFGFPIIAGNHRLFSHNSWPCPKWLRNFIALMSTFALQGPVIAWVALHREHHHYDDTEKDPHSPAVKGKFWVQFLSYTHQPDLRYALDLYKDKWQRFLADYYWLINISLGAVLYTINPLLVGLWLGGTFLAQMNAFAVNTFCHYTPKWMFPTKETIPQDNSRNVMLLALIDGGEGWHLNHHRSPWKWTTWEKWYQFDLTGIQIFFTLLLTNPKYLINTLKRNTNGNPI